MIKCEKKKANCEGIANQIEGHDGQSLNHFVSDSFWDPFEVMKQITIRSWNYLTKYFEQPMIGLIIDEMGVRKFGKHSACVSRQWLGCLGKQDNGQVFVAATLVAGKFFSLLQMKLFMPESWEKDSERRKKCRIPKEEKHLTKTVMAKQMIENILELFGAQPFWVGFDALYGCCSDLWYWLDEQGQRFVGEIKASTYFYLEDPEVYRPQLKNGGNSNYFKTEKKSIKLEEYVKSISATDQDDFLLVHYREGTKNKMEAFFHRRTVWIWNKNHGHPIECELLIKKEGGNIFKASIMTLSKTLETKQLAYMQGQRYFVEQSFKEGKNQTGLGDYQVRSWEGTHRHLVCSMLAENFLMEQRHKYQDKYQNITLPDIVLFISILIPSKIKNLKDLHEQFLIKHTQYTKQIQKANQKNGNQIEGETQ